MSVSVLEALQNANYNLKNNAPFGLEVVRKQLNNAVVLLEKGYDIHTDIESLLEKYGHVSKVPEKE